MYSLLNGSFRSTCLMSSLFFVPDKNKLCISCRWISAMQTSYEFLLRWNSPRKTFHVKKIERKRGMIPRTRKEMHLTLFNIVFHGVFYGTSHFVNSGFNLSLITTSAILKCFPCKAKSACGEYKRHCTQTVIKIKRTKTYVIYSRCHRSNP